MGNKKNHAPKNKRLANNWRKIIKMRKCKKKVLATAMTSTLDNLQMNDEFSDNEATVLQNNTILSTDKQDCENLNTAINNCSIENVKVKEKQNDSDVSNLEKQTYYVLQKFDPDQYTRIIRGDFHQGDERFVELSRGKQGVAVSIVALCFFKLNDDPSTWKTADINDILNYGDILYHASYQQMKLEGEKPKEKYLSLAEVYPYTKIGGHYFCFNETKNVVEYTDLEKGLLKLNSLENSLYRFFNLNNNKCGFFTCKTYSFAIIQNSYSFFLFNSYAMSYAGEPMDPNDKDSAACLMEMCTIRCLANHLLVACNPDQMNFDGSECDSSICYSLTNLGIEKKVFGKDALKRKKVNRHLSVAEKNRGGIKRNYQLRLLEDEGNDLDHRPDDSIPKRENLEGHALLDKLTMQNQTDTVTINRSNQIGDNKNSNSFTEYEFDKIDTSGTEDQHIIPLVLIGCGMLNLGNSCFFNACLQAFFHIPVINIHLQKIKTKKCTCVVCNMISTFKETHAQNLQRESYNPTNLYHIFQNENKDLLNGKQQDAHEFWMRLMNSLESKTNSCTPTFEKLFLHDVETLVKCGYCDENSRTKETFSGHVIDIRGRLTIREALEDYFAEHIVETYNCEFCKTINKDMAKKKHFLKSAPKILCLMLNRFENKNVKIKDNIGLSGQLKLSVSNETSQINYRLASIINHFGSNLYEGHYTTTACISNHSYYEFDDLRVYNIIAPIGSNAYILLYELSTELEADTSVTDFNFEEFFEVDDGLDENTEAVSKQKNSENDDDTDVQYQEQLPLGSENHNDQYQENKMPLRGNRIVDIAFIFEQMKYINKHSEECDSRMVFSKETKLGFRSIFHFECSECGIFHKIHSSSRNDVAMNINKAVTLGITSVGSGFYHLEEFCAHSNIPCMSSTTFEKENKQLQEDWWKLGRYHSEKALNEEIEHAIATGNVDSAGNALITVVCDGSWGKRSYGKGFSSLSGCAAIIGVYTKKVIYYDVKNKYCHTCTLSYANFCPPNDHTCHINYVGPSSGMETEIIVEGFQACERMGARFNKIISDGDSSAFKEIRELSIYRNPDLVVEKLECVNHLYKNARKKISALCGDTTFGLKYRKLLKPTIGDES